MLTRKRTWMTALLSAALACAVMAQDKAEIALRSAMERETVRGDLKGAIEEYRKVAVTYKANRAVAAKALLRLGQAFEKLGSSEAKKSYEQIVREFPGESESVATARVRLAALQGTGAEARPKLLWDDAIDSWGTVSGDGRYLSFVDWETGDVAVRDLQSGTNRRVTDHGGYLKAQAEAAGTSICRDGTKIAYSWEPYNTGGRMDLRVIGADGQGERVLKQVKGWIEPHGWSPDGKWIAAIFQEPAFVETEILILSAVDGTSRKLPIQEKGMKQRISFSPDGEWLAYSSGGIIYAVRADGMSAAEAQVAMDALMLGWTPDGQGILFSRKQDGAYRLFLVPVSGGRPAGEPRMVRAEPLPEGHSLGVTAKGGLLIGAPNVRTEGWLMEFDSATGRTGKRLRLLQASTIGPPYGNSSLKFSPDGTQLLYKGADGAIRLHSVATGSERTVVPQLKLLRRVEWAPDSGSLLAVGAGNDGRDGLYRMELQTGAVKFLAASPLEARVLSGTDGTAMIYSKRAGVVVRRDLATNEEKTLWGPKPSTDQVPEAAFSRDGKQMAVRAIAYLGVVDLTTGRETKVYSKVFGEKSDGIWAVDWSPDGKQLFAVGIPFSLKGPSNLITYSVQGGESARFVAPGRFRGFSLSPDGKLAAFLNLTRRDQVWMLEDFLPAK